MTYKPTFLTAAFAAAFVLALGLGYNPATVQAQSILAPADDAGLGGAVRGRAAPRDAAQDTYGGIVSAPPQQSNNPYGNAPPANLYEFVQSGGDQTPSSIEDGRRRAQEMRQARTRAQQQENLQRTQEQRAQWTRARQEAEQKQKELLEEARRSGALPYRSGQ